jgi:hypothetical protein
MGSFRSAAMNTSRISNGRLRRATDAARDVCRRFLRAMMRDVTWGFSTAAWISIGIRHPEPLCTVDMFAGAFHPAYRKGLSINERLIRDLMAPSAPFWMTGPTIVLIRSRAR